MRNIHVVNLFFAYDSIFDFWNFPFRNSLIIRKFSSKDAESVLTKTQLKLGVPRSPRRCGWPSHSRTESASRHSDRCAPSRRWTNRSSKLSARRTPRPEWSTRHCWCYCAWWVSRRRGTWSRCRSPSWAACWRRARHAGLSGRWPPRPGLSWFRSCTCRTGGAWSWCRRGRRPRTGRPRAASRESEARWSCSRGTRGWIWTWWPRGKSRAPGASRSGSWSRSCCGRADSSRCRWSSPSLTTRSLLFANMCRSANKKKTLKSILIEQIKTYSKLWLTF